MAGVILKQFYRNVPWVILFKNCLRNFDPSINMALVNRGYFNHRDIPPKKILAFVLSKIQVSSPEPSWPSFVDAFDNIFTE